MNLRLTIIFFTVNIILNLSVFSQKLTQTEKIKFEKKIEQQFQFHNLLWTESIIIENDTVANIKNYQNGFAIISYDKQFYPLKAFSDKSISKDSKYYQDWIGFLQYDYFLTKKYNKVNPENTANNRKIWQIWLSNNKLPAADTIGPLLASEYGQVNCRDTNNNLINVTNYYTPNHYAVGCVALTFAEIMRYYNWPIHGQNTHSYTDNYGDFTGNYSADFQNTTYLWDNIQDKYYGVTSTDESRQALGKISFDAAVSVDMDFENDGSTSDINRIPYAASHFFRYDMPLYAPSSDPAFWTLLDQSIQNLNPVALAVYTSSGAGHAIVCDGLIEATNPDDNYYHLNMGWWGNSNGWYHIQSDFNAGGYSIVDGAVFEMIPIPELKDVAYDIETNTATISWYYSDRIKNPVFELQQKTSNSDWQTIEDNYIETSYTFTPNTDETYKFRIKESKNTNWSEEVYFDPQNELSQYDEISFFPTLADKQIFVQYKNLTNTQIDIYATNMHCVYSENLGDFQGIKKTIDISNLPRGVYIIRIITEEQKRSSFKFVCEGTAQ